MHFRISSEINAGRFWQFLVGRLFDDVVIIRHALRKLRDYHLHSQGHVASYRAAVERNRPAVIALYYTALP